jgi:sugar/nucleoside kinase (ribokinase family)
MTKTWDVAVAGEIFADHIFFGFERWPTPGEEHFTENYIREAGGGAAVTACALAHLGRNVIIFAVAGEKDQWIHDRLRAFGVDLDGLREAETATAVSVCISTREDRSFLTWPGANRDLVPYLREPQTQIRLAQAKHVHFAMPIVREFAMELFPQLREAGCTLSLDVGHYPDWLRDERNWPTCAEVDFFLPNEREAQIITGSHEPGHEPDQLLNLLQARGFTQVVLKLGRMGAAALLNGQRYSAPALTVDAVDTTGAGDAFDAGLIDAFLDGAHPSEMLANACLCGSLSTRKAGALNALPDREELNRFHDQYKQS